MALFDDELELDKLKQELKGWEGTKYKHRCFHKGLATDCIGFVAGVLVNLNIVNFDFKKMPHYARDYHLHNTRSLLIEQLFKYVDCEFVDDIQDGDLLLFNFGQAAGHLGFHIDGWLHEAIDGQGVAKTLYKNSVWKDKLSCIVRINSRRSV